jgi:hypothetical protein
MTAVELEVELKAIDPRFKVIENPNRPGLSNILFEGKNYDLPTLSTHDIREEADPSYRYEFPNGMSARHHSRPEILDRVQHFLIQHAEGKYKGFYED